MKKLLFVITSVSIVLPAYLNTVEKSPEKRKVDGSNHSAHPFTDNVVPKTTGAINSAETSDHLAEPEKKKQSNMVEFSVSYTRY